jgi:predicted DsbA family dithiol-disulfide isomerase
VRLRKIADEMGDALAIEERAFPLRPAPEANVPFKGTYREAGWQRCHAMSSADGITFTPWPHPSMPGFSLPALQAARCVAKQGHDAFVRVHLALFRAYFTESRNIADPDELVRIVGAAGVDVDRFIADYHAGIGRDEVISDYEAAVNEHGVRSIPTVIVPATGRYVIGLVDLQTYRAAIEEAR